jgi:hypothetical protein
MFRRPLLPVRLELLVTRDNFSRAHRQRKKIMAVIPAEFFVVLRTT